MTAVLEPAAAPDPGSAAASMWDLVVAAQNGDRDAYGALYERYMDTVFRFVYFRTGNRQIAEDIVADTFERAWKRIGSFVWQGRDIGAWFITISRNLTADYFKGGRYRLEVTTGDVLDADQTDRPDMRPEEAVTDYFRNRELAAALKQLNEEQLEVLVLRFYRGLDVKETCAVMGKKEGAVKALQYRAVRAVARALPQGWTPW